MIKTKARRRPTFHTPEVWLQARIAYLEGADAAECEKRFGIREDALRRRARLEGWTRRQHFGEGVARTPDIPADVLAAQATCIEDLGSITLTETALWRAWEAVKAGRPKDAAAFTKAAVEVGGLAEVVVQLKRSRAEEAARSPDGTAAKWGAP